MFKNKTIIALIPARKNSKGLVKKNICLLCGKPLIHWSIAASRQSQYVDRVVVSTDCEEIGKVAQQSKAEFPFLRPDKFATDHAKAIDVILHALDFFEQQQKLPDILLLLQPTSPLRTSDDIDRAIELYYEKKAKSIISVCPSKPPWYINKLPENGSLENFLPQQMKNKNRQETPDFYTLNGAIYLASPEFIKNNNGFFGKGVFAYIMPRERSVDIDYQIDLSLAECLMKQKDL